MSALLKSQSIPSRRSHLSVVREPVARTVAVSPATYQRRRLVALFVAALTAFTVWYVAQSFLAAVEGGSGATMQTISATSPLVEVEGSTQVVTVRPGDTLWSIAQAAHPKGDFRPVLNQLAERYGNIPLVPGTQVVIS